MSDRTHGTHRVRGGSAKALTVRKSGRVAIVGRSNAGKSTLLNAVLEMPLAIVSPMPQTTRDQLLGVVRHQDAEIGFLDTPGLHRARTRLGREMNRSAKLAARDADVIVYLVGLARQAKFPLAPHPADLALMAQLPEGVPLILAVNKIDLVRDKSQLLPLLAAFEQARPGMTIIPISARAIDGVHPLLDEIAKLLKKGEACYGADDVTDKPMRYFAAEYVREAVLAACREEVPHALAVTIDEFLEPVGKAVVRIVATLHVEREGQKRILIGKKGEMMKRVGSAARARIEELLGRQVHLELWVRVSERWRESPELLADFGLVALRTSGDAP